MTSRAIGRTSLIGTPLGLDETRLTRTSNAMGTFEACRRSG